MPSCFRHICNADIQTELSIKTEEYIEQGKEVVVFCSTSKQINYHIHHQSVEHPWLIKSPLKQRQGHFQANKPILNLEA